MIGAISWPLAVTASASLVTTLMHERTGWASPSKEALHCAHGREMITAHNPLQSASLSSIAMYPEEYGIFHASVLQKGV